MSGFDVVNFGCRLNAYEAEIIKAHGRAAGLDHTLVFNTCAVTKEAQRQAFQAIRKAKRLDPSVRIVVTGCAAQIDPKAFAAMAEVDLVVGNSEKMAQETWQTPDFGIGEGEKVRVDDIMSEKETALHLVDGFGTRARAFVQIQNGCDHRCTFCIIPFGRGNSRSVPAGEVVRQIALLAERWIGEVVLTGVDITAWGRDLPGQPGLGDLVQRILRLVPALPRLRLSSIDSVEVDERLRQAFAEEPRLMPHIHLSLQSGDDLILKRMKRRHSRRDAVAFCAEMRQRRPDMVFGADLIAGFPTESETHFEKSLQLIEDCGLTLLHVFPYSARPGTPAARMPQLDGAVIRERAQRLREAGKAALSAFLHSEIGGVRSVLVEQPGFGRTEHSLGTRLDPDGGAPGTIIPAVINGVRDGELVAS